MDEYEVLYFAHLYHLLCKFWQKPWLGRVTLTVTRPSQAIITPDIQLGLADLGKVS